MRVICAFCRCFLSNMQKLGATKGAAESFSVIFMRQPLAERHISSLNVPFRVYIIKVSKSLPVCVILEILPPVSRESSSFAIYLIVNASCGIIIPLIKRSAQIKNIIDQNFPKVNLFGLSKQFGCAKMYFA